MSGQEQPIRLARPRLGPPRRGPLILSLVWTPTLASWYAAAFATPAAPSPRSWQFVLPFVAAGASTLVLVLAWRRTRRPWVSLLVPLLASAAFLSGSVTQHEVAGRPVPAWSELDEALDLHARAVADLELLRAQQRLLELPRAQGLAIVDSYAVATERSLAVARDWNPAASPPGSLPGLGFEAVQAGLNEVATLQADALTLYAEDLRSPQEAVAARAAALRDEIALRLSAADLAATIEAARISSVALLR